MVSRVIPSGELNRTPCQPSMTWGPLVPSPSRNRPPDSACIDIADIASSAGVRAPTCAIPVASRIRLVFAARNASGVKASYPQASATHTESAPRRSASTTKVRSSSSIPLTATPTRMPPSVPGRRPTRASDRSADPPGGPSGHQESRTAAPPAP